METFGLKPTPPGERQLCQRKGVQQSGQHASNTMGRSSIGKGQPMRCIGITIMLTLAATTHAGAQECERVCHTQAQTLPAQDGKP